MKGACVTGVRADMAELSGTQRGQLAVDHPEGNGNQHWRVMFIMTVHANMRSGRKRQLSSNMQYAWPSCWIILRHHQSGPFEI